MSLELFKINQSIFIPVSFVEHLNKHSKMSKKILLLGLLRSHINLSWKLILPRPSCFQAGVKSLERLKTCLHCDKHHEARLSALDAAPSNLNSIWKTAPVCWPRQSKANHFLPACQLLRSYQCHADGKTFRGWSQLPPKECSVKVKGFYVWKFRPEKYLCSPGGLVPSTLPAAAWERVASEYGSWPPREGLENITLC